MVDGFGVPVEGFENSLYAEYCPKLFIDLLQNFSIPLDACLGVEGIPQSATGQTSLFTGVNAAEYCGMHMQAFPGPSLRELIRKRNIYSVLLERGYRPAFANSYIRHGPAELLELRYASVTTVMSESLPQGVFRLPDLRRNEAVVHDITRETLDYVEDLPKRDPEDAAFDLLKVVQNYDFVLFEYFMTDRIGHKRSREKLSGVLHNLGTFIAKLSEILPENTAMLLCSDHGNCEDITTGAHTMNPVPMLLYPDTGMDKSSLLSIKDVMDFILLHFPDKKIEKSSI